MTKVGAPNKQIKLGTKTISIADFCKPQNKENKTAKWAKENKAAIEEYNEHIKKYGVFGDSFRSF